MNRRRFTVSASALAAAATGCRKVSSPAVTELGVCTGMANAQAVKDSGGDYIEEKVRTFLVPEKSDAVWLRNLESMETAALPVHACNYFLPGSLRSTGRDANHQDVLAYAAIAFSRARQAGIKTIVFGSSGSRSLKEGDDKKDAERQFVDLLKKMGLLAEKQAVTVVVEPLRRQECNFINTVIEGAAIVEQVKHPNIRLLFDIYHMLQNGENPADLKKVAPLLVHGHIAEKEQRSAPGVMGDDFRPFFAALQSADYAGRLSIEGQWKPEELPKAFRTIRTQALM